MDDHDDDGAAVAAVADAAIRIERMHKMSRQRTISTHIHIKVHTTIFYHVISSFAI